MSTASFDSKKSINAGVARRLMGEVEQAAQAIAARQGSAAARLRKLLTTVHQMNSDRYVGDSKMHEMVACRDGRELGCLQGAYRIASSGKSRL